MHCRAFLPSKVSCFPTRQRHEKGSTFLRGCNGTADDDEKAMASQDQSQPGASQQPTEETSACAASEPVVALGNQPDWEMFERRWKDADNVSEDGTVCTDIVGEYEFVRMLGAGRYGRTFHAIHRKSRAEVAMKVYSFRRLVRSSEEMHGNSSRDERLPHPKEFNGEVVNHRVRVFRLEKLLTRCLTGLSPFVTSLAHGGVTDTSVCDLKRGEIGYLSELMPGDIHRVWRKWAKVDDPEGRERENFRHMHVFIAAQMTDAVRFLHCCGVVHHDLSTGNILIGRDGYIKVTDFGAFFGHLRPGGFARECGSSQRFQPPLHQAGRTAGGYVEVSGSQKRRREEAGGRTRRDPSLSRSPHARLFAAPTRLARRLFFANLRGRRVR